ncbi:MAG: [acyl-carrier-protein] S-malonyltransferase [Verrucomicrobiales bacterium]|jgi:[acyl-carrier-protein] S-malonyltransferase
MATRDVVLLFAGQGAQKVGMGQDLAEANASVRDLFDHANATLGFSLTDAMFNGPIEELTRTSRCQPALFVHGLACLEVLKSHVPDLNPVAAAGLSLGEFTAHAAAGTFDFKTGLGLVAKRGSFMEEATDATEGSMAAMIGGDEEAVRQLAKDCDVDVANFNAPGQIVVSGAKAGITAAIAGAREKGIKIAKELNVAGAYHSRLMLGAQEKLGAELIAADVRKPAIPVICNVEAREVSGADEIRSTLTAQVASSVRWTESMQLLLGRGHTTFVELGPGGQLAGMLKRIDRSAKVLKAEDADSIAAAAAELNS